MEQPMFLKGSLRAQIFRSKPEDSSVTLVNQGFAGIGKGSLWAHFKFITVDWIVHWMTHFTSTGSVTDSQRHKKIMVQTNNINA